VSSDFGQLLLRLGCLNKHHIGSGSGIGVGSSNGFFEAERRTRIGARDDQEIRIPAGIQGRAEFLHHLFAGDHFFPVVMAAPLGGHLIFKVQGSDPSGLEGPDGAPHINGIAVPGIGIADHGDRHGLNDAPQPIHHLRESEEADVGITRAPGDTSARGVNRAESRRLHNLGGKRIESSRRKNDRPRRQHLA